MPNIVFMPVRFFETDRQVAGNFACSCL